MSVEELSAKIQELEERLKKYEDIQPQTTTKVAEPIPEGYGLSKSNIERYSRQLLLPTLGAAGQQKLLTSSILLVGAGGLTSSCAMYLAGAGVGKLGIVDFDVVEESNLHRQIIHTTARKGEKKVESARASVLGLNPHIECLAIDAMLTRDNAMEIVETYDVIIDCSDNLATRYLVNDVCVLTGKPFVSGSAIGLEGQLSVYNYKSGPCYRCMHPKPARIAGNCSNNGVLGLVPGIIGCLQALEALKIITNFAEPSSNKLLLFDARDTSFSSIKIPGKNKNCAACSEENRPKLELLDYELFCSNSTPTTKIVPRQILEDHLNIHVTDYKDMRDAAKEHILLDVRSANEFSICHLPGALNIPLKVLKESVGQLENLLSREKEEKPLVFCMCRRGGDSQTATQLLRSEGFDAKNVTGGLQAWSNLVDTTFPVY